MQTIHAQQTDDLAESSSASLRPRTTALSSSSSIEMQVSPLDQPERPEKPEKPVKLTPAQMAAAAAATRADRTIKLTDDNIGNFYLIKNLPTNPRRMDSMSYSFDGHRFATVPDEDSINVYDLTTDWQAPNRKPYTKHYSKKYGVEIVRFSHETNNVIHSSTKMDNSVRLLSLEQMHYMRYFTGHNGKVTSIVVSPKEERENFFTCCMDKVVRFWESRSPNLKFSSEYTSVPVGCYDPDGVIVAMGFKSEDIHMFDQRNLKAAFARYTIPKNDNFDWTSLSISQDGKTLIINTNGDIIKLIDSFKGTVRHTLGGIANPQKLPLVSGCPIGANHVFCGGQDGIIQGWNMATGAKVAHIPTDHVFPMLEWNPHFCQMVSVCKKVKVWNTGHDKPMSLTASPPKSHPSPSHKGGHGHHGRPHHQGHGQAHGNRRH